MDMASTGIAITVLLLLLVVAGVRVGFAAGIAGLAGIFWHFWQKSDYAADAIGRSLTVAVHIVAQVPHAKTSTNALSLIPVFVLIGYLAWHAGLTRALFEAAKRWIGWLPGGMAVATVFATAGFAAVSGASVATAAVFARVAIPEMLEAGYDRRLASGVVAAAGTLSALIPPSALLVIYAIIVERDVGSLLLAGFIPGMFSALAYGSMVVVLALLRPEYGPPVRGFTWRQRLATIPGVLPVAGVVFIIIVFVYNPFADSAFGTPAEGGAIGVFMIFLMALVRGMGWRDFIRALMDTARLSAMIFTVIWGVLIYVRFLGYAGLPAMFAAWISSLATPPMLTLVMILLVYAVLGMFMDAIGMLLLTLPITFPAIIALNGGEGVSAADSAFGMDATGCAIWFGIIVVKMAELCLITPPIGLNCFVVAGVCRNIPVADVFRGAAPFCIADAITLAGLVMFPGIVLYLPGLAG